MRLTAAQRVAVDFAERLSEKWGMTFYFYESQPDGLGRRVYRDKNGDWVRAEDGFYDPGDGSIHIDLNAGTYGQGAILFTVAHELTHHIQQWSPRAYNKLCDILTQGYLGAGQSLGIQVQYRQELAREANRSLTYGEAYDEVMAHSLESVLADGRVMELLEQIEAEDKSLAARVRRFFRDMAQLIWKTVDTYRGLQPDSPEGRMVQQMKDLCTQLEDAFAQGLYEAGQNFSQADKGPAREGGIVYSLRVKYIDGTETLEDPSKITRSKILNYLKMSSQRKLLDNTYFPVAAHTPEIINTLQNFGIAVSDKPLAMQAKKAKQAQNNQDMHTKDGYTIRGHAMSAEEIIEAIDKLNTPDAIVQETERKKKVKTDSFSETVDQSDAFVVFVTLNSGQECVVVIEFDSTIDPDYIKIDGKGDEYHTTITVFKPDVTRKGIPYDYFEYLNSKKSNRVLEITEESSQTKTAYGENLATVFEKELSNTNISQPEEEVKENDSTKYRYSGRQDLRQKNPLAAAIREDAVHAHETLLQEMVSRGIDQRSAGLAVTALLDAAYNRATQRQVDFMRYMRTESLYAAQYNAALEAVFPSNPTSTNPAPAVGTDDPVAVPGIFVGAGAPASAADRGHSLGSLFPPPAALSLTPHIGPSLGSPYGRAGTAQAVTERATPAQPNAVRSGTAVTVADSFVETSTPSIAAQDPITQPDAATSADKPLPSTDPKPLAKSQKVATIKTGSVGDHFDRKIRLTESSDDLKQTNPNYATGEYKWRNNCQRCVPTYELRRRGYNVIAKKLPASIEEDYLARDYTLAWSRRERIWCKQGNGLEQVQAQMEQWGDGSRAEISVLWAGTNNIGHVFVAEQRNGKTYFVDPQNGSVDCSKYFMLVEEGKTNMLRIDNNEPSEKILDCCENRR